MSAKILKFPLHLRADRSFIPSNHSGEIVPFVNRTRANLYLWGTEPRQRHFSKFFSRTPKARAAIRMASQLIFSEVMARIDADKSSDCQHVFGCRPDGVKVLSFGNVNSDDDIEMAKKIAEEAEELIIQRRLKAHMKAYRKSKRWTQPRMAKFLNISKENYQKYELADPKRKVPIVVALRYCDYAGYVLEEIAFDTPAPREA